MAPPEELVLQYFQQLTQGCGSDTCQNPDCRSGSIRADPSAQPLDPTDAFLLAQDLAADGDTRLCAVVNSQGVTSDTQAGRMSPTTPMEDFSNSETALLTAASFATIDDSEHASDSDELSMILLTQDVDAAVSAHVIPALSNPDRLVNLLANPEVLRTVQTSLVKFDLQSETLAIKTALLDVDVPTAMMYLSLPIFSNNTACKALCLIADKTLANPIDRVFAAQVAVGFSHAQMSYAVSQIKYHITKWVLSEDQSEEAISERIYDLAKLCDLLSVLYIANGLDAQSLPDNEPLSRVLFELPSGWKEAGRPMLKDLRPPTINWSEFYIDAVNESVVVRSDFIVFLQSVFGRTGPRFSFCHTPFVYNALSKSHMMRFESEERLQHSARQHIMFGSPFLVLNIRRDHIVQDALQHLVFQEDNLMRPLKVVFVNEEGVDAGGVTREFYQLITQELFDPKYNCFEYKKDTRQHWFMSTTFEDASSFELIGILLGMAVFNRIVLDVAFPKVFYRQLLELPFTLDELHDFDPELFDNLTGLRKLSPEEFPMLCLTFSISENFFGEVRQVELKPNGSEIAVSKENVEEYIYLYADYLLRGSIKDSMTALRKGFVRVFSESFVFRCLSPSELERLIVGSPHWDMTALQQHTKYAGGYNKDTPTIRMFWDVVHSLTPEQQRRLLFFCTGSDRVPVGGLKELDFCIKRVPDTTLLPTAHTCMNLLDLPPYNNEDTLQKKLLIALEYAEGFGFV